MADQSKTIRALNWLTTFIDNRINGTFAFIKNEGEDVAERLERGQDVFSALEFLHFAMNDINTPTLDDSLGRVNFLINATHLALEVAERDAQKEIERANKLAGLIREED